MQPWGRTHGRLLPVTAATGREQGLWSFSPAVLSQWAFPVHFILFLFIAADEILARLAHGLPDQIRPPFPEGVSVSGNPFP